MSGGTGSPPGDGEPRGTRTASGSTEGVTDTGTPGSIPQTAGAVGSRLGRWWAYGRDAVAAHFHIDARALAAFRISLGALVIANLLLRSRYLGAFYTDDGVYPRWLLAEINPLAARISLFSQFGSAEAQAVLFVITGIVGVALLVGYRTTLATVITFAFVISLNGRNLVVINGGDILLRHLLFWAILLPIGKRWSIDAIRRDRSPRVRIASLATAGLLLQVVAVYAVNAVTKHWGDTWGEGLATQYIFQLDQFTVLLGDYVAEITPVLVAFDYAWYWMVTLSILLVVLRGWPRAAFAATFVGAHASMFVTMQIGIFPLISIASLLVFFPAQVWDRVERHVARPLSASLGGVRDALAARQDGSVIPRPSWSARVVGGWRSIVVPLVAALAISTIVVGNAAVLESGDRPRWNMFAPDPLQEAIWVTTAGTTASGDQVDAFPFHEANVSSDRPPDMADTYPTARWRKYFNNLEGADGRLQTSLADYLCRQWNATHEDGLANVTITQHVERVDLDRRNPLSRDRLEAHDCTSGPPRPAG